MHDELWKKLYVWDKIDSDFNVLMEHKPRAFSYNIANEVFTLVVYGA
jgi:hypothetical protein